MAKQESTTVFKISDFFTASMQKIMNSQDKFESKVKSMESKSSGAFSKMKGKLENFKIKNMEAISDIASEIPGGSRALALATNPYVAGAAAAIGVGVAIKKATDYAQQWEAKMAEVNVTAQLGKKDLKGLSDELLNIGKRNVAPLEEVPQAFNRILSAGLDVNTALGALEPTLRAAKAGFADMETVAGAGVAVMNSSGENINKVYDTLFATLNRGNAKFQDIAQYLPKIIPQARSVGFALGETAGAWAYLTAQGQTAERSTTLLENAFKSLANPDRVTAFNKMGVAIFDNKGKMLPLVQIIDQLSGKMNGLTDKQRIAKLASLGLDQEASGAFAAMTQNVDKLRENIDFTTNSTGQLNEAYKNAEQSGDSWAVVSNRFKVIWEKFGEMFLPMLSKAGTFVLGLIDGIENLWKGSTLFRDVIGMIGERFSWLFQLAISPLVRIWNIVSGTGKALGWLAEKVGLGTGSFESMYLKVRPYLTWIHDIIGKIGTIAYKIFTFDFTGAFKDIKNFKLPNLAEIKKQQQDEIKAMQDKSKTKDDPKSLNPDQKNATGLDLGGMNAKGNKATAREGSVSGGGTKAITINIQHLLSGVTVNTTQVKEGAQDIGRIIREELEKMLADVSLSGANG